MPKSRRGRGCQRLWNSNTVRKRRLQKSMKGDRANEIELLPATQLHDHTYSFVSSPSTSIHDKSLTEGVVIDKVPPTTSCPTDDKRGKKESVIPEVELDSIDEIQPQNNMSDLGHDNPDVPPLSETSQTTEQRSEDSNFLHEVDLPDLDSLTTSLEESTATGYKPISVSGTTATGEEAKLTACSEASSLPEISNVSQSRVHKSTQVGADSFFSEPPPEVPENAKSVLEALVRCISHQLPNDWIVMCPPQYLLICKMSPCAPLIQRSISIQIDGSVELHVHSKPLPADHELYKSDIVRLGVGALNESSLQSTAEKIVSLSNIFADEYTVCCGEESYTEFWSKKQECVVDENNHSEDSYTRTLRSEKCSMLVKSHHGAKRCYSCKKVSAALKKLKSRLLNSFHSQTPHPNVPNKYLSSGDKRKKLKMRKVQVDAQLWEEERSVATMKKMMKGM